MEEMIPVSIEHIYTMMEHAELVIAAVTFIGCCYVVVVMSMLWLMLEETRTRLRLLVLSIVVAKMAIGLWSASIFFQLDYLRIPARTIILGAVLMQVVLSFRYFRDGKKAKVAKQESGV
jgi:hypothetical protein